VFRIGFFTNGNKEYYFDNIDVQSYECERKWDIIPYILLETDSSNIYEETWEQKFELK